MSWKQSLGEDIEKARRIAGKTQDEVAHASGLARNTIGHYERGERAPDFDILKKIASAVSRKHFDVGEEIRILFTDNEKQAPLDPVERQLTLSFDANGGVTVRIQPQKASVTVKAITA